MNSWKRICGIIFISLALKQARAADLVANSFPPVIQGNVNGTSGQALAIDAAGNRYVTGSFSGALDFNPGVGSDTKTSLGSNDVFVTRFNADGSYAWTQTFGGSSLDVGLAVAVSGSTVYATGYFSSPDAQVGGTGPALASSGNDVFVMALDAATGAPLTVFGVSTSGVQTFGGSGNEQGNGVLVNGATVYVTGGFNSSNAKVGGAGPAIATSGSSDAFVLALDAATGAAKTGFGLNSSGVQKFGGTGADIGYGVALVGSTLYVSGNFSSTVQIGGAGPSVASTGFGNVFVMALDAATGSAMTGFGLNSSGIQTFGGTLTDNSGGLTASGTTLYATGNFTSTDAQIGGAGPSVGTSGAADVFVVALDTGTGAAKTAFGLNSSGIQKFGGSGSDIGFGAVVNGTTLYLIGNFSSTAAQVGGAGPAVNGTGTDAFVVALDSGTGAAKSGFGLNSSGVQTFGPVAGALGAAMGGSALYFTGGFVNNSAGIGGPGVFNSAGFGSFLVPLDPTTGSSLLPGVFTSPLTVGALVNTPLSYTITTTGSPTGTNAVNLPVGLNFNSGTISGSVSAAGTYSVPLTATFASGTITATLTLNVIADAVAVTYPPVIQGTIGTISGVGGPSGHALALDASGNRYVTGVFSGTRDFNPGAGGDVKTSVLGSNDGFVTRFNADGSYAWTQTFGGSGVEIAEGVAVSGTTVYVTGYFNSINAQIGGTGPVVASSGNFDAFVLALDTATGAAKTGFGLNSSGIQKCGGSNQDRGYGVAVSGTTVYVTGFFSSTDMQIGGTGPSVATAGSNDAFVLALDAGTGAAKPGFGLNSSGIQTFGGSGADFGYSLAVSGATVYVAGTFNSGNAQIGGAGNGVSSVGSDAFVLSLDSTTGAANTSFGLNSSGIQKFGGSGTDEGFNLAIGGTALYLTGYFNGSVQIGGAGPSISTTGNIDAYVIALDPATGAAKTTFGLSSSGIQKLGGFSNDYGTGVAVNGTALYVTGYSGSSDMQIGGTGPTVGATGNWDAVVFSLDAVTGAANTGFGVSSSGIQKIGGTGDDRGYALALNGTTLYVAGSMASNDAGVGGTGAFNGTGFGSFILGLDAATGFPPNQAPAIGSANSTVFTLGVSNTFTVIATGVPTPTIARGGVALPSGVTFVDNGNGTGTLSGTPAIGTAGTYALTFMASNTNGNSPAQNFSLTVSVTPTITSVDNYMFSVGAPGTFTVTAVGAPTPSIVRNGVALPNGVTFVDNGNGTGTLGGTPTAGTGGTYAISFTATNINGNSPTQNFTLNVNAQPAVQFSVASQSALETAGTFAITVTQSAVSGTVTTVPFSIGGTALAGTDYSGVTTSPLSIPAGQTSATIMGVLLDDGVPDGTKTLIVTLGTPTNATLGAIVTHTLTITEPGSGPPIALSSGPTATPNPATVNQSVAFTAAATGGIGTLSYAWNFGDNTTGTGASTAHAYGVAGTFNAVVTVTDTANGNAMGNVNVTVTAGGGCTGNAMALVGSGPDSDCDGFSDSFENAVGTDASSAASTPTGAPATAAGIQALTISKASIKLNFAKPVGNDSISFSGTVAVPAGFNANGAKTFFLAGDVIKTLTLTAKGSGVSGGDTVKVALKAKKGVVQASAAAKYTVNFKKGTFAATLASSGLTNGDAKAVSVMVPFTFIFNNTVYQKTQTMSYSAKMGKTGMAK